MKVLLVKDKTGVGRRGEVVEVSEGFAKNLLISKGFAVPVDKNLQSKLEKEDKEAKEKKEKIEQKAENLKADMERKIYSLKVTVGDKGQVFGGIREKEVIDVVNEKLGTHFKKDSLKMTPLKHLGIHEVTLKLPSGTIVKLKINLEPK